MGEMLEDARFRIQQLRKERGLTQEELAARIAEDSASRFSGGVHLTSISKIENGKTRLTLDWVGAIARALKVTPHEIIGPASIRFVPWIGQIAAGNWSEAIEHPSGYIPAAADVGGPNCFALQPVGDSMDRIVVEGGWIIVDPDQRDLIDRKLYAVRNAEGETTFKQYQADPPALLPCSSNPAHQPIPLGREPFTVIGRVTWVGWMP